MKELGVLVPIVTPCSLAGEPDHSGLKSVTRYMLEAGSHAFFVAGSTGRGPWFSRKDRATICRTVAETAGSNVPLFAGCMASGLSDMLDNARAMKDAGAHYTVLAAPGYFAYSQSEIEAIFLRFADDSPLPVLIYDIPALAGMKLDLAMVQRLARHGNVMGFKDSSADLPRFCQLADALKGFPDFYLLQGKEHQLADALYSGASGLVVSMLHVDPRPFVALVKACREGQDKAVRKLQTAITEIYQLINGCFTQRPESSTLFHFLNCALKTHRVCDNILLEHEGDCPAEIAGAANKAVQLGETVVEEFL